ncbi:MAG: hypothetical protein HRT44_00135 [Bdellovibrionales bacterium]|nr:hypothetical protein [Bdellovibrionales bacterium]NQZ17664.1 hypothetical protein [Bdellovibrionales bacterium]
MTLTPEETERPDIVVPNYLDWFVTTNNNYSNNRGLWSTTLGHARPHTHVYTRLLQYSVGGVSQPITDATYKYLGATNAMGELHWGGLTAGGFAQNGQMMSGCPPEVSCSIEWGILVEGH